MNNVDLPLDHNWMPSDYIAHYVWVIVNGARMAGRVAHANDAQLAVDLGDGSVVTVRWSDLIRLHEFDHALRQRDALCFMSDIAEDAALPRWLIALLAREIQRIEEACHVPF